MRTWLGCVAAFLLLTASASAQWITVKVPRTPRSADGKPNLTAPAPRTADGKPDLSGIWAAGGGGGQRGGGGRGAAAPATPPPANAIPVATFGNAGQGFPEGLPFQPWAADLVKKRMADNSKDNPDAHCLPMGFMQFHNHPEPRKIIQTPEVTMIVYEANSGLRQIFTDGRALPPEDAEGWW